MPREAARLLGIDRVADPARLRLFGSKLVPYRDRVTRFGCLRLSYSSPYLTLEKNGECFMRRPLTPIFTVTSVLLLVGCAPAQPTPEEQQMIEQLIGELAQVQVQIDAAEQDDQSYTGGLIKTLIAVRLEVLKTNHALIQQRIHALESGAEIEIVVSVSEPDPELTASLLSEIETQRIKVAEAEQEADLYSGGLLRALALSTLATAHNTLAMLEQRYLSAKYGFATPLTSP